MDNKGEEEQVVEMPTFNEQLHGIVILRRMAYVSDIALDKFLSSLCRVHAAIRRKRCRRARQATNDDFFKLLEFKLSIV